MLFEEYWILVTLSPYSTVMFDVQELELAELACCSESRARSIVDARPD